MCQGHVFGGAMTESFAVNLTTPLPRERLTYTLAGEPDEDGIYLLQLARLLTVSNTYPELEVLAAYMAIYDSRGTDTKQARQTRSELGALARMAPLGIWCVGRRLEDVAHAARQDAQLTHSHGLCPDACAAYAMSIALAISHKSNVQLLYRKILEWMANSDVDREVLFCLAKAETMEPEPSRMGEQPSLLDVLHNAFWQLLHTDYPALGDSPAYALLRTGKLFGRGDQVFCTAAAICGALLGALHGASAMPSAWQQSVEECIPQQNCTISSIPQNWPIDLHKLARGLLLHLFQVER